ncbi:hypothetical protein HPC37_03700 [Pasteurellaceae bacterium 20609_3]|uniref:hypothetical protein n=1 Tax=Spirabiliibacterium mucosae TaxID=28156 RepID=UPI001AAD8481|nr:hypothetical protein [Spirabiliibacterium mucosae]MBE2897952.1 hypothetical protein [Spirabiliibacterium mucosae]
MHIYNEFPLLPNAVEHYNHLVALTLKEDRGNLMYRGILTTVVPCFDAKRNEKLLTNKQIREAQKVCDYTIEDVFRMAIEG